MPKFSAYNSEVAISLRTFFLANPSMDLRQLARLSESICGQEVPYEKVKELAGRENWEVQRAAKKGDEEVDDVLAEVQHIRRMVYQQMVVANEAGLLVTGLPEMLETASNLLGSLGENVKVVRIRPGGLDASMVNAYMNLLAKTNMNLNMKSGSGKTGRQEAIELSVEADKELDEYYQSLAPSS